MLDMQKHIEESFKRFFAAAAAVECDSARAAQFELIRAAYQQYLDAHESTESAVEPL